MNKSIRFTSRIALILTAILLVNLTVVQAFSTDKYAHDSRNMRGFIEQQKTPRGQIFAGNSVLAESVENDDETYTRTYPEDSAAFGPVTGYLSSTYGASQLEQSQNDILNGTDDALLRSNFWDTVTGKKKHGANVGVTINPALQQAAFDQFSNNDYQGSAVAIQPSTGKILAMASAPSYRASAIADGDSAEDAWNYLQEQDGNPLLNHATQETLPPGSIFKIITTAAGLNNGFDPSSSLTGESAITLPGTETQLTNYAGQACNGSDQVSLETAFAYSCNTAFVQMADEVGGEELEKYAQAFGVGEKYDDLGVGTSPGQLGDLPDPAAVAQSAIGQRDVTMSALQAAIMAGTVANNGKRMKPYLVDRITDARMNDIRTTEPKEEDSIDEGTAATIKDLMFASEHQTFGYDGNGFASKTGTAEHGEGLAPHTWYVAFDPDRDIAVGVVVKDGGHEGEGATGGKVSARIGRAILNAYQGGE